jgi:hypothetical protein
MRIERITKIDPVLECIPFEQEIRNKGRDSTRISKMLLFLKDALFNPLFGFWIAYEEDKIIGYTIAMLSLIPSMERLILWRIYAKRKDVQKEFRDVLGEWAKDNNVKIAVTTAQTESAAKAYERIDGWHRVSINLERRI